MKKFLGALIIMVTVLCSSMILFACSDGYKKMYLEVEYALPKDGGGGEWHKVKRGDSFDYILDEEMRVDAEYPNLYVMYLRVNVKGTSKKIDSLYLSVSETSSVILPSNTIKPNETFKVYVSTTGSATFKVTPPPNKGGEDKSVSFGVNIYHSLESINQNPSCIPAVMVGDALRLDELTNLIDYIPVGQTNQIGVDYKITGIGKFDGQGLLGGDFGANTEFQTALKSGNGYALSAEGGDLVVKEGVKMLELMSTPAGLLLRVSPTYYLDETCNVVQLEASSTHKPELKTFVYIYLVEKFSSNSWLVSYSSTDSVINPNNPIESNITIYNSKTDETTNYDSVEMYTHLKESIYSYQTSPGMDLIVKVNGEVYEYAGEFPNDKLGIKITKVSDSDGALKFSVYPEGKSETNKYQIELSIDFTDFDFSASDSKPKDQLKKTFTISVESLPSAFSINAKSSEHNIDDFNSGNTPYIVDYNDATQIAELYTTYIQSLGMPLDLKVVPTDVKQPRVNVKFYKTLAISSGDVDVTRSEELNGNILTLRKTQSSIADYDANTGFGVDGRDVLYLSFDPDVNFQGLEDIFMVTKAVCTPSSFEGKLEEPKYVINISKIKVVGAVDNIKLYKDVNDDPGVLEVGDLDDRYLPVGVEAQTAYVKFESNAKIDYDKITISSKEGNVQYSKDGIKWESSITADTLSDVEDAGRNLYKKFKFRVLSPCDDTIIISSPNGYTYVRPFQFVNLVSGADSVEIRFDDTYITQFDSSNSTDVIGTAVDKVSYAGDVKYGTNVDLAYLALQAGAEGVQFRAYGDGNSKNIASVEATKLTLSMPQYLNIKDATGAPVYANQISKFSSTAVMLSNLNTTFFDVKANSVGFTSILLVKVNYYVVEGEQICLASKYFVYEIAVYVPASELEVTNKDSILYINDDYLESATVDFDISWKSATKELAFSSDVVNQKINAKKDGVTSSIYAIRAESNDITAQNSSYFKIEGLFNGYVSLSDKRFTLFALDSLTDLEKNGQYSVSFDIIIEQFGQDSAYSITKVVAFGQYEKSDSILITGADSYDNIYISLSETKPTIVTAEVSNVGATYKEVGYQILSVNRALNIKDTYKGENLKVRPIPGTKQFDISAYNFGGVYEVVFYAKDSYNKNAVDKDGKPALVKYDVKSSVLVTVLDGKTPETAFLVGTLVEFKNLVNAQSGQHYRLSNDIDFKHLDAGDSWWSSKRVFGAHLDGSSTIYNPNTGVTVHKSYRIIGLKISNHTAFDEYNRFSLFGAIASTGTIKNIIFNEVVYDIMLNEDNTDDNVAIGAIAGINNGIIENCSVTFKNSSVTFVNDAQPKEYNIGLVAGINNGTIKYNNTQINSEYAYMVDFEGGSSLNVVIGEGNTNLNTANINIGGVVGQNTSTISATYEDNSDQAIRTLITAVVNIEIIARYVDDGTNKTAPIAASTTFGGIAGLNNGTINKVAISGSLKANDKVNMGGIAGENAGKVQEVANYGACIEGYVLMPGHTYVYTTGEDPKSHVYHSYDSDEGDTTVNLEQNIGGIVGFNNKGAVDNVRTMFVTFENTEVSIMPECSYIMGVGNVGGIIGKAINTQLTRAYVEKFISDAIEYDNVREQAADETDEEYGTYLREVVKNNSNIIGNNAVVGGLIACAAKDNTKVTLAFVKADFMVKGSLSSFTEFGATKYNYVYFIGDVCGASGSASVSGNAYIVRRPVDIPDVGGKYSLSIGTPSITSLPSDLTNTPGTVTVGTDTYYIGWRKTTDVNEFEGVDYPYLIYKLDSADDDDKAIKTLTVVPYEIIVKVDNEYFGVYKKLDKAPNNWATNWKDYYKIEGGVYTKLTDAVAPSFEGNDYYEKIVPSIPDFERWEEGLYVQYTDSSNSHGFSATAIVYYHKDADNIHKLVTNTDGVGLIEKAILPSIASGEYSVSIVLGSDKAVLIGSDSIKFNGTGIVKLKFASAFDRTIQDIVTIFVENPISDEVFDIAVGSGLQDINNNGSEFSTSVGQNPELSVSLQKVNGETFNAENTYMKYNIISGNEHSAYFEFTSLTNEIAAGTGKYLLGSWQLTTKNLPDEVKSIKIKLEISVYLNLNKYSIDGQDLYTLTGIEDALLGSKEIVITIHNKATNLSVDLNDITAESGVAVSVTSKLTTGYVGTVESGVGIVKFSDERLSIVDASHTALLQDTLYYALSAENQNAIDLVNKVKADYNANKSASDPQFSIWYIFDDVYGSNDVYIKYKRTTYGYDYVINFNLREEYRYLDISDHNDREWKFKLTITASTNATLSTEVSIAFVPQKLHTFRLENYSNLVSREGAGSGTTESEFVSNEVESSLIIPGESGLVKIYAERSYAYFNNITIASTIEVIDGKEYFVRFQQMVFDKDRNIYVSYAGITSEDNALALSPISYFEDGKYSYDGVIFVRTILENIVGVRKVFTFTVGAKTYDPQVGEFVDIECEKTVISQYRPGVYVSVAGAKESVHNGKVVYMIEENATTTQIVARVYGYEFNIAPTKTLKKLDGGLLSSDQAVLELVSAQKDESGVYVLVYNLKAYTDCPAFEVVLNMELVDGASTLTSNSEKITFYPVEYVINDLYLAGESNGSFDVSVNTSRDIELVWITQSGINKSEVINNKLLNLDNNGYLKSFYFMGRDSVTMLEIKQDFSQFLNSKDTAFSIKKNKANNNYRIEALGKQNSILVHFELYYGYEHTIDGATGLVSSTIYFSTTETTICSTFITHQFYLNLVEHSTEDLPRPVETQADLEAMNQGENYILTKDITVRNWKPLTTAIGSLDGNGYIIKIESFDITVTTSVNAGLFATTGENTILKNIVVDISSLEQDDDIMYIRDDNVTGAVINFGMIAGINNGLIYNCEVISLGVDKKLTIEIGPSYSMTFGGLVGVNNGNITNSRVGTEYFERITPLAFNDNEVSATKLTCESIEFTSKGLMAGLVGVNNSNCIISSSYVANTSIINMLPNGNSAKNRTAGFIVKNNGAIAYSYVKGLETSITSTNVRATGCKIYSNAGSVAGFVYENAGTINDCYSNIMCESDSAGVAGFVYDTTGGTLKQCYTASKVTSRSDVGLATQLPFVGVGLDFDNAGLLLSSANIENCYYLDDGTVTYDRHYTLPEGVIAPKSLGLDSFAATGNLNNYSFVTSGTNEQQLNGVWTYSTAIDANKSSYSLGVTSLPELTSANFIARSMRIARYNDAGKVESYVYANGYDAGSVKNPFIIRSVEEYAMVFVGKDGTQHQFTGNVRFIDNIDFKIADNLYEDVATRSKYVLGDQKSRTISNIDGNGMTISNLVINYSDKDDVGSLGLFSEAYYAVIKALNVEYASVQSGEDSGDTKALYAGGIAGFAKDVYFIDLNLSGGIAIRSNNIAGGLVGQLTGNSGIYNINSDLHASAGFINKELDKNGVPKLIKYNAAEYATKQANLELFRLSYAGGIAGIIDIENSDEKYENVNKIKVISSNVEGEHAAGIAGYLGKNVYAKRLTYVIDSDSAIIGSGVAGGIVADNYANIELSQINSETIEGQYNYDKEFADYINSSTFDPLNTESGAYGNLSAVQGDGVVGGFIGINYCGNVKNSLTKANIGPHITYGIADTIGGFAGISYGGNYQYVYAQNYIDLTYDILDSKGDFYDHSRAKLVGGFAGKILKDIKISPKSAKIGFDNVVVNTFFDKSEVTADVINGTKCTNADHIDNPCQVEAINVDYLVAQCSSDVTPCLNDGEESGSIIRYGNYYKATQDDEIDDEETISKPNPNGALYAIGKTNAEAIVNVQEKKDFDIYTLYNAEVSKALFEEMFLTWPFEIWESDHTKFLPNLKSDNATDYIQLYEKSDLKYFEMFPDRNFILMNNIEIGEVDGNYVVPTDFSGILISNLDEKEYAKFTNIKLRAYETLGKEAGFFKSIQGARISNIGFEYAGLSINGALEAVGGIAPKSFGDNSRLENVTIGGTITTTTGSSVQNLGSLIGSAGRVTIVSCSSSMTYDITSNLGNIGGLIGSLNGEHTIQRKVVLEDGTETTKSDIVADALIRTSPYSGTMNILTSSGTTVGGLVGSATYADISSNTVAKVDGDNFENINITVGVLRDGYDNDTATTYLGGVVGKMQTECQIDNCATYLTITSHNDAIFDKGVFYIGGIAGHMDFDTVSKEKFDIKDSYSKLTTTVIDTEGNKIYLNKAYNLILGGIAGQNTSSCAIIENVASDMVINTNSDSDSIDNVTIGGIVGQTNSSEGNRVFADGSSLDCAGIKIKNAVSIMESSVHYDNTLLGGGIIGQAGGKDTSADTSYEISNSAAIGYIHANSSKVDDTGLTVLGGFVGLAGSNGGNNLAGCEQLAKQTINNSYTVLTLSAAGVYKTHNGKQYNVYTNSIVGYMKDGSTIEAKGVLYSSDYTLAFDDYVIQNVENVTAYTLSRNISTLKPNSAGGDVLNGKIGGNWIWFNGGLPVPNHTQNFLIALGILSPNANGVEYNNSGKAYNPIIHSVPTGIQTSEFDAEYKYHLLTKDSQIDSSINTLHGVILGCNFEVKGTNTFVGTIHNHSAISNIKFIATSDMYNVIAAANNGTIFMCGVQYNDIKIETLVGTNNGTMSYCYNSGNSLTKGSGLVATNNTKATIEYSYFTGSFYNDKKLAGSALVDNNEGYIGNSYSAGQASKLISTDNSGRYYNVKYDYYANYIKTDDIKTDDYNALKAKGIEGVSTEELQAVDDTSDPIKHPDYDIDIKSELFGKAWAVYGMHNLEWVDSEIRVAPMTYNYGYPIHNIRQYKLSKTGLHLIAQQGAETGNGTFDRSPDEAARGTLVYHNYKDPSNGDMPTKEYYDDCAYQINNIGVLYQINKLNDWTSTNKNKGTAGKYFELVVNIQLPDSTDYKEAERITYKLLSSWPGLTNFAGTLTSTITAASMTDGKYILDTTNPQASTSQVDDATECKTSFEHLTKVVAGFVNGTIDNRKTITNLRGDPLINKALTGEMYIGASTISTGATITNIVLQNSFVNNATLINTVEKGTDLTATSGSVTIYNAGIKVLNVGGNGAITAIDAIDKNCYGLVADVKPDVTLNLHTIEYADIEFAATLEVEEATIAGVIGSNEGTINIKNSFDNGTYTFNLQDSCGNATVAGFINQNLGTINAYSQMSLTFNSQPGLKKFSGFVMSNGVETPSDSEDVSIKFNNTLSISSNITQLGTEEENVFSGFAQTNYGQILTVTPDVPATKSVVPVSLSTIEINGLLAAGNIAGLVWEMKDGIVDGFDIKFSQTGNCSNFGGIVGKLNDGQIGKDDGSGINVALNDILIVENFGGVACFTTDGSINKSKLTLDEIELNANASVKDDDTAYGVVIGKCEGIESINYEISDASKFIVHGKNVGGIIGESLTKNYNFRCEQPSTVEVYGLGNVGGFAGKHGTGDILEIAITVGDASTEPADPSKTTTNWILEGDSTKPYAKVEWTKSHKGSNPYSNYGGFVGFWNSKATITGITNANPIFEKTLENSSKLASEGFSIVGPDASKSISNVGGIVGYSLADVKSSKNDAQIGMKDFSDKNIHEGNNPIYGTDGSEATSNDGSIKEIPNISYIGGLIGFINAEYITLSEVSNSSSIYGIYAVGGLIGGTEGNLTINGFTDTDILGNVGGLSNIGGIIGIVGGGLTFNATFNNALEPTPPAEGDGSESEEPAATPASVTPVSEDPSAEEENVNIIFKNIYGITNVGGIVGFVGAGAEIDLNERLLQFGTIMGNINVGGIAGYIGGADHKISSVTLQSRGTELTDAGVLKGIYGTVFDYYIDTTPENGNSKDGEIFYYHPTNIGGVVGAAKGKTTFEDIVTNAVVSTDSTYTVRNGNYQVRTVKNHVASYIPMPDKEISWRRGIYSSKSTKYSDEEGGIGGFVGLVETVVLNGTNAVYGDVYAPYGINVGGAYGHWLLSATASNVPIPQLGDEVSINVAGKIFVGAAIGKVPKWASNAPTNINVNVQQYDLSKFDNDASTTSKNPKVLQGHCIGGLFGYSQGNIKGVSIEAGCKIKIFNSTGEGLESQYVGVIAGRIDGSMEECSVSPGLCGATESTKTIERKDPNGKTYIGTAKVYSYVKDGIIQSRDVYNYGGLVGLAQTVGELVGELNIQGTHYYAFTIDTVYNSSFEDFNKQVTYNQEQHTVISFAHYLNKANINVSASSLNSLYDLTDDHNPIYKLYDKDHPENGGTKGWAPEYTMFKTMARTASQTNTETGDYVQTVYDARNITEVKYDYWYEVEDGHSKLKNEIVYTVYHVFGQPAKLYCKYGVAELTQDFDTVAVHASKENNQFYDKNYELCYDKDENDWYAPADEAYGRDAFHAHIYDTKFIKPEHLEKHDGGYFPISGGEAVLNWHVDDDAVDYEKLKYTFGFTYYDPQDSIYQCKNIYEGRVYEQCFVFTVVFGNIGDDSGSVYSGSGSLFEVYGVVSQEGIELEDGERWFWILVNVVIVIIVIVAACVGAGYISAGIIGAGATTAGAGLAAAGTLFKAWIIIGAIGILGAGAAVAIGAVSIAGAMALSNAYYPLWSEQSQGYMHDTYAREISWTNGKLDTYYDTYNIVPVTAQFLDKEGNDYTITTPGSVDDDAITNMFGEDESANGKSSCTLYLIYFAYCLAGNTPTDYHSSLVIPVEESGHSDTFAALDSNITHLRIPRYTQYNDVIYIYTTRTISQRVYPNYDLINKENDAEGTSLPLDMYIHNADGYAYIVKTKDNQDEYEGIETSCNNLNIDTGLNFNTKPKLDVPCAISSDGKSAVMLNGTAQTVNKGDIKWKASIVAPSFTLVEKYLHYSQSLYEVNNAYHDDSDIIINETHYRTAQDEQTATSATKFYFWPDDSGNCDYEVIEALGIGKTIPDTLYYVRADEIRYNTVTTTADCFFCPIWPGFEYEDETVYTTGEKALLNSEKTFVVYASNTPDTEGDKIEYTDLYKDWETYKDYYLSKDAIHPLSHYYIMDTDDESDSKVLYERKVYDQLKYSGGIIIEDVLGPEAIEQDYAGRYAYENAGGRGVTFFARYIVNGLFNDNALVSEKDADGNYTTYDGTSTNSLLLPSSSGAIMSTGVRFSESVRVSMSGTVKAFSKTSKGGTVTITDAVGYTFTEKPSE